jgi:hypothetical protein
MWAAVKQPHKPECALKILSEVQQIIMLIGVDHWDTPAKIGTTFVSQDRFGTGLVQVLFSVHAFQCAVENRLKLAAPGPAPALRRRR